MDSIRSWNVLKQDTESFYYICRIYNTITQSHNTRCSWGKTLLKTPLSYISYSQIIMKQYNAFSHRENPTLF